MTGFYTWSRTASANASSDNAVNWAEGMAPSAVNDSARAMMASTAKFRDDTAGALTTSGTSTAYTIASYQGFDTLAHLNGQMIAFTPHTTNGATVTLSVDGLGAKPLRRSPGVDLPAAVLIQGSPYVATYFDASGEFILQGFYKLPEVIPVGGCIPYLGATVPNANFAFPFGQAFSRTAYPTLFALLGTTHGSGDGSTTFNGPDIRGRAIFGQDNMGGTAAGRLTTGGSGINGSLLGATGGAETHTLTKQQMPSHNHGGATGFTQPSATSTVSNGIYGGNGPVTTGEGSGISPANQLTIIVTTVVQNHSHTVPTDGSDLPHNNMPPSFVCPVIMRII